MSKTCSNRNESNFLLSKHFYQYRSFDFLIPSTCKNKLLLTTKQNISAILFLTYLDQISNPDLMQIRIQCRYRYLAFQSKLKVALPVLQFYRYRVPISVFICEQ
jgi:hypothetical protein